MMVVGGELLTNNEEDLIMTTGDQWRIIEHDFQFEEKFRRIYDISW